MALSKSKKESVIKQVDELLNSSKLTVAAKYSGTSVKALEQLRKQARENGTIVKVIKNRLVIKALEGNPQFKDKDLSIFREMLLYAFNSQDEVESVRSLADFAKSNPNIEFVIGLNNLGELIDKDDLKEIAALPSKEQLRAILAGTLKAPLTNFAGVLKANLRSVLFVLKARENSLSN